MAITHVSGIEKYHAKPPVTTLTQDNPARGSFRSFEDVFRTSYSHGLEAIYHIETVDLKTVRRINDPSSSKIIQKTIKSSAEPERTIERQLEFDFGDSYRESMDSFVLDEPIQILEISRQAEKCLAENGMGSLRILLKADLSQFVYLKGMGQGHIDEIQQKLDKYIDGRTLYHSLSIDFYAWVRSLVLVHNIKKMHVMLEPFKLSELCILSPAEKVEVRRLTTEKRQEWRQEMALELYSTKLRVKANMKKVTEVYILPWIRRRQGFATQQEIIERIQRVSVLSQGAQSAFLFFTEVYFGGRFPLSDFLLQNDEDLFFADQAGLDAFNDVVMKAKTYFYKSGLSYALVELVTLLAREFALSWQDFPEGFIEKCLRSCSYFSVRKGEKGLTVRLT